MTDKIHPLSDHDAPIVQGIRKNAAPQRGKFVGVLARPGYDALKSGVIAAGQVDVAPGEVNGVSGWWCRPANARQDARLLYLHGGAYLLGTAEAYLNQVSHYAHGTRTQTFIPDYSLAPERPFPAAVDDTWRVYLELGKQASHLIVAGDSAGGGLALAVLARAASQSGAPQACGAALMSPWVDLTLGGASMQMRAEVDPIFTPEVLRAFVDAYVKPECRKDPAASPLFGTAVGLPPLRIDVGNDEILLDDSTRYTEHARAAGVSVTLDIWEGMPHSFQSGVGRLQAADLAMRAAAQFLVELLDSAEGSI